MRRENLRKNSNAIGRSSKEERRMRKEPKMKSMKGLGKSIRISSTEDRKRKKKRLNNKRKNKKSIRIS